ncbi:MULTISPECIES: malonate decarboxylase holo-[acyl-carrier-protein] synthase [unclassified Massilia]|uniref:malonate decarboxylase holo-[acyl-carrier-protein] synthase n=1 Tax=unclassified Massilia TaxID=2609279 RepID=UPI00177C40D0|nr:MULTISPECIES: malonate decarboxylase holo-[acyl-carrier-protein] synthase [unclassified Massilia]MBD8533098.1 malonate decarboxylase holo-[acyl-carrier-protein] synthase [Massilia sp. CFBP 13647]MBD8676545.1 malonate decarboxylase holo-[acyl-carrier-protein] synthase [Massilia sp. CFBP 13721]
MFSRHDLIWLSARGWERAAAAAAPGAREAIACWGAAGWPAVVTRTPATLAPGEVALGIALPPRPDGAKPRIALAAAVAEIARGNPALPLAEAIAAAPAAWQAALAALDREATDGGCTLRVYGSLAFAALTGQTCLRAGSDIDLLLHPADARSYEAALDLLVRHARVLPLDGEIVFGGGQAVAWKELAGCRDGQARVLAKSLHGVALVSVDSLLASLHTNVNETAPCTA